MNFAIFTDDSGKPSFARVASAVTICCALIWVSYVVAKTGMIPDLTGLSIFVGSVTAATYGVNKAAGTVSGKLKP